MCDEACGQTPKITRECRGDECRAEHPQLIHKVIEIATCVCGVCGVCGVACVADDRLRTQVELSYPAFTMKMPSFVDPELEALFLSIGAVKNTYMVPPTHHRIPCVVSARVSCAVSCVRCVSCDLNFFLDFRSSTVSARRHRLGRARTGGRFTVRASRSGGGDDESGGFGSAAVCWR